MDVDYSITRVKNHVHGIVPSHSYTYFTRGLGLQMAEDNLFDSEPRLRRIPEETERTRQ